MTMPDITIPPMQLKGDSGANMIYRKTIQDIAREIPSTQIQFTDPLLSQKNYQYLQFQEAYHTLTQN